MHQSFFKYVFKEFPKVEFLDDNQPSLITVRSWARALAVSRELEIFEMHIKTETKAEKKFQEEVREGPENGF